MDCDKQISLRKIGPFQNLRSFNALCECAGISKEVDLTLERRFADVRSLAVLHDQAGTPLYAPTMFLAECALRSRAATPSTTRTYAESILNWIRFLETKAMGLSDPDEETLLLYRAKLANGQRNASTECFATATVNLRVSVAALFHQWGQRSGVLHSPLGHYLTSQECQHSPFLQVIKRIPQVLTFDQLGELFSIVKEPYKLMFQWALCSGARRFEVCNLKLFQLPEMEQLQKMDTGLETIRIVRKGGKESPIVVPTHLLEKTYWYVLTERIKPELGSESFVFLNKRGRSISPPAISSEFRRCADAVGLKSAVFHHLRHTFATNVLHVLQHSEEEIIRQNAAKILQVMLGHAQLETTEIYIHSSHTQSVAVFDALAYLYGASQ